MKTSSEATDRFYKLVWPHRAVVLRAAYIHTGNAAEADDLAQETLLKAFKAIESYKGAIGIKTWLLTILRNARIDRLRAAAGSHLSVSLTDLAMEPEAREISDPEEWKNPEEIMSRFSDAQVIEALQQVPEDLRWTLLLVDVQQTDQQEAADILAVPVGTIKSRLHRGRAMLREALLPMARDLRVVNES